MSRFDLASARLYAIIDTGYTKGCPADLVALQMVAGGVDLIQLRAKTESRERIVELARAILPMTRVAGIPLIINDYPDICAEVGADGVHIGQEDGPVAQAREKAGPDKIVGKSTHSLEQAVAAAAESPDYIAVGPLFSTPTKPDYEPVGLELIAQVKEKVSLPFFCIGGIKLDNLPQVLDAGAPAVVVVSGILQSKDIEDACRRIKNLMAQRLGKEQPQPANP